jgi:hypothetical protein
MPPHPLRMVTVRAAVNADGIQAMVYATEGFEIPRAWTSVQLSPHITLALRSGDLEERGPDDQPLSKQEVERKYGSGPSQRRAIHRPFRPPVRHEQGAKEEQPLSLLPAPGPASRDVASPAAAPRAGGRPGKEEAKRVRQRNEWVAARIAAGTRPMQAYKEAGEKFEDSPETVGNSYTRSLRTPPKTKPTT